MLTENRKNYGGSYNTYNKDQYLYQPVLPAQTLGAGLITFTVKDNEDEKKKHRNNLSLTVTEERKLSSSTPEYDAIVWILLVVSTVLCIIMWVNIKTQTAFTEIKLTQFSLTKIDDDIKYVLQSAGTTKPLHCFISAFFLIASSLIVGWQSKLVKLNWMVSLLCFGAVVACQIAALWLHFIMYTESKTRFFDDVALTATSTIVLHCLQSLLTVLILAYYVLAKPSSAVNTSETIGNFWLCVVEDLNTIVCYVLVVRGCDAQSSVHDDTSTFFDIVCVVLIGFLQHVANVLMIMHGYLEVESDTKRRKITAPAAIQHYADTVTLTPEDYNKPFNTPTQPSNDADEEEFRTFAQELLNFDRWLQNRSRNEKDWAISVEGKQAYASKEKLETILVQHLTEKLNQYVDQNSKYIDDNNRFKAEYDTNLDIITSIARSRAIIYFMIGIVIVFFYLRIAPTTEEYALGIPYETIRAIAVIMMVSMGTLHSLWFEMRSQSSQGPLQSWDTSPAWKLLATASIALVFCSLLWQHTRIEA
jgi:hypothetical protein